MKCGMPHSLKGPMLARLGPKRSCIMADCRRSIQVRMPAKGMVKSRMKKPLLARAPTAAKPAES